MTRLMTALSCFLLLIILYSLATAWMGRQDNKPVDELSLMQPWELRWELISLCLTVAYQGQLEGPQFRLDGIRYAQTIALVARKQPGDISQPLVTDLIKAMSEGNPQTCERVHNVWLEEEKRKKRRKSK